MTRLRLLVMLGVGVTPALVQADGAQRSHEFLITETSIGWANLGDPMRKAIDCYRGAAAYRVEEGDKNLWRVYSNATHELLLVFHGKNVGSPEDVEAPIKFVGAWSSEYRTMSDIHVGSSMGRMKNELKDFIYEPEGMPEDEGGGCYSKKVKNVREEIYFSICETSDSQKIRSISTGYFH